ncbi:MAG TPA: AsmA family protein [Candidatus Acidoferrales bacterium]
MSETISDAIAGQEVIGARRARRRPWSRWLKGIILILAIFWVVSEGISVAIRYTPVQKTLAVRIEAVFGRPVEVGSYDFSLWGGPTLSARSVTVAEDPQFGREYFLRAESVSVRLRWQSLLRGRIEAGTISLDRPSLNIVLAPDGRWNVAEWLPRATESTPRSALSAPPVASPAPRFRRIEVEDGRLNFKHGYEKLPFAFVGVTGAVEANRPGRWSIDLQGTPWRAAAMTQQAGALHLTGEVGGTSSRLRPAVLNVDWPDASVSDVLRLVRGDDRGIRGFLSLAVDARTLGQDGRWSMQGRAAFRQIHGWDIPLRPDNPSLNLAGTIDWDPSSPFVQFTDIALDAPNSRARASGRILWDREDEKSAGRPQQPDEIALSSARADMGDVLAWIRAFHLGIADSLSVHGSAQVQAKFAGWPPHIVTAEAETDTIQIGAAGATHTARLDPVTFQFGRGKAATLAANLAWGPSRVPEGAFRLDASFRPAPLGLASWHIIGRASQTLDLIAGASAIGWNISHGWDLAGPLACDLRWKDVPYRWSLSRLTGAVETAAFQPAGWIEIGSTAANSAGAKLRVPFLNHPIDQIKARAELRPGGGYVTVSSAQAFGARWTGTLNRRGPEAEWQFALSTDRLATADLDRWLNPAWKESFLDRMLPFLSERSTAAAPENLRATGRIAVGEFVLPPLHISHLQGNLELDGRRIALSSASGRFYDGQLSGSVDAILAAVPVYRTSFDFSNVSLSSLASASPNLTKLLSGSASGEIWLEAHGASRAGLIGSLTCQGRARLANAELRKFDISMPLADSAENRTTLFPDGSATFSCAQGRVEFQKLDLLSGVGGWIQGTGTVDFNRNVDFRLRALSTLPDNPDQPLAAFHVGGSLAAPQVSPVPVVAPRGSRQR